MINPGVPAVRQPHSPAPRPPMVQRPQKSLELAKGGGTFLSFIRELLQ